MTVASCASGALATEVAVLDELLGVVPRHRLARNTAIRAPVAIAAKERPERTDAGAETHGDRRQDGQQTGRAGSRSESRVQMSTTLPYSGFSVPSMIPGCSWNCRRTSKMIAPAAGSRR